MSDEYEGEKWAEIPDHGGYLASTHGRIGTIRSGEFKVLSQRNNNRGYYRINFWKNNKCKIYLSHRMIMAAFFGNAPKNREVNHIDGDKKNNKIHNLEWVTRKENVLHAHSVGLRNNCQGREHYMAKLNESHIIEIVSMALSGLKNVDIAKRFSVSASNISSILNGKSWRHVTKFERGVNGRG